MASASASPSVSPSRSPSVSPSMSPSRSPSVSPSVSPSKSPSVSPSASPSEQISLVLESTTHPTIRGVQTFKWTGFGIGGNNIGKEILSDPTFTSRSVQVEGTWDGATVTIQGSNMIDSPVFETLYDSGGNAISFTTGAIKQIRENTYWIRPVVTGLGVATNLDVYLLLSIQK